MSLLNITFPPAIWTKVIFYIDKSYIDKDFLSKYRQGKSFLFNPHILNRNMILGLGNNPGTNAVHFHTAIPSFKWILNAYNPCKACLDKGWWFILRSQYALILFLQNFNFSYLYLICKQTKIKSATVISAILLWNKQITDQMYTRLKDNNLWFVKCSIFCPARTGYSLNMKWPKDGPNNGTSFFLKCQLSSIKNKKDNKFELI